MDHQPTPSPRPRPISLKFHAQIPTDKEVVFQTIRSALISLHGMAPNHYQVQLRDLTQLPGEPHQQFILRVRALATIWVKDAPTRADVISLITMEKAISHF